MSDQHGVREVDLGDFCGCGAEFFLQQRIDQSKKGFEVEIPGRILRSRGAILAGYKDAAVLVNDEGTGRRAAWLGSDVPDTGALIQAIHEIGAEMGSDALTGFAVRVGTEAPVGEILDGLAARASGCGCEGDAPGAVVVPGSVRIGLAGEDATLVWSSPVAASLLASPFPASSTRRSDDECTAVSVGPNATACYGSKRFTWNGWLPEVYTVCVGRCSSGDCCIRRTAKGGTCVTTANGWHSCSCI